MSKRLYIVYISSHVLLQLSGRVVVLVSFASNRRYNVPKISGRLRKSIRFDLATKLGMVARGVCLCF